jgi:hypothetical protein
MNLELERYAGELTELREKVIVYEQLLHKIQMNAEVVMDHEVVGDLITNICRWSYAHRCGNGENSEAEQDEIIRCAFDKLLVTRDPWTVRNRKAKEQNEKDSTSNTTSTV